MTRRTTGWLLLALALVGAVAVAALGFRAGSADPWLVTIAVVALAGAAGTVLLDRRVLARRGGQSAEPTGSGRAARGRSGTGD